MKKYLIYKLAIKSLIYAKIYNTLEKLKPKISPIMPKIIIYVIYGPFEIKLLKSIEHNFDEIRQII